MATPKTGKPLKTTSDYVPDLFNVNLLKKKATRIISVENNERVIEVASKRLRYTVRVSDARPVIDVYLIKDELHPKTQEPQTFRLVANGDLDDKVMEFWHAIRHKQAQDNLDERDAEVKSVFNVLSEVLADPPDYQ